MSIKDHEKNVSSQEVRAVIGQDFLEWPDTGLSWAKSNQILYSTPMRSQINSGSQDYNTNWLKDMMPNAIRNDQGSLKRP